MNAGNVAELITNVIRDLCELEYPSIEGEPDILQVTAKELTVILKRDLESLAAQPVVSSPAAVEVTDEMKSRAIDAFRTTRKGGVADPCTVAGHADADAVVAALTAALRPDALLSQTKELA